MTPRSRALLLPLLLSTSWLVGCPGTGPGTPQPGGSANYSRDLGDGPDFSDPHGRVQVQTWLEYGETALQGSFADGPPLRFHEESDRRGNCRLMTYSSSACSPGCTGGAACIGGECVAWPERQDLGDLIWSWPDGEQTVSPDALLSYYATGSASSEGDVSITVGELALSASTIGPPVAIGSWVTAITSRGTGDATLRWQEPILDARVRLYMSDCTASHGGLAAAEIECEGPDIGELVVPGEFLDALEDGDWSHGECGGHSFVRYHSAAPEGDAAVRLEALSDGGLFYFPGQ